jgi:CBS domain-containing protein
MDFRYAPLPHHALSRNARLKPALGPGTGISPDSPALAVMTDFAVVPAAKTTPSVSIDEANRAMIERGVRSLIVVDSDGVVVGILTATDVLGERPLKAATSRGVPRNEVAVQEIMTPAERIEVLPYESLAQARVGHVVATLLAAGRQHGLVVERDAGGEVVRGIFSLSQIANALGIPIEAPQRAETFADIEAALARN